MRLLPPVLALLLLQGCNTPSPGFQGLPVTRITVQGSTFDIRQRELQAEAMRLTSQYAPRFGQIRNKAAHAMAQASGCDVVEVTGDQALAFGTLDCGNGPPPPQHVSVPIECVLVLGSGIPQFAGGLRFDLDCDPA